RVQGHANHRAAFVNADAVARQVAGECAQILHPSFPGPEKSVKSCVASQVRATDDLASVINVIGGVSARLSGLAAEIAQVRRFAVFPEQGMNRQQAVEEIRIERCTSARRAGNLSAVVDAVGHAVWIAPNRRQSVNRSFFPDDGLKLEKLESRAS